MTCHICDSTTWIDDDLHWTWCDNPKCREHFYNKQKQAEFQQALAARQYDRQFEDYDD